MAVPFSRTMRSLEADRGWGSWLIWVIAFLLAAGWLGWFTTAHVTAGEHALTPAQMLYRKVILR